MLSHFGVMSSYNRVLGTPIWGLGVSLSGRAKLILKIVGSV